MAGRRIPYLTPQEAVLHGDRHDAEEALKEGKYWTPNAICTKESTIEEINAEREKRRFFRCFPVTAFTGNPKAVIGLNPLDPQSGEVRDNPRILIYDQETDQATFSPELTEKFYTTLRQQEEEYRREGKGILLDQYSFFIRETPRDKETEGPSKTLEGMKNV